MTGGMDYTPSHTNFCKFFNFQLTFSQLILHLKCWNFAGLLKQRWSFYFWYTISILPNSNLFEFSAAILERNVALRYTVAIDRILTENLRLTITYLTLIGYYLHYVNSSSLHWKQYRFVSLIIITWSRGNEGKIALHSLNREGNIFILQETKWISRACSLRGRYCNTWIDIRKSVSQA